MIINPEYRRFLLAEKSLLAEKVLDHLARRVAIEGAEDIVEDGYVAASIDKPGKCLVVCSIQYRYIKDGESGLGSKCRTEVHTTRCLWPPDRFIPRLPTAVRSPSGRQLRS